MDIVSITAIALGLIASMIAVLAHLRLPTDEVMKYEETAKAKVKRLQREVERLKAGRA